MNVTLLPDLVSDTDKKKIISKKEREIINPYKHEIINLETHTLHAYLERS